MNRSIDEIIYQPDTKMTAAFEKSMMKEVNENNQYSGLCSGLYLSTMAAFSYGANVALQKFPDNPECAGGIAGLALVSAYNAYASARDVTYPRAAEFTKGLLASSAIAFALYQTGIFDENSANTSTDYQSETVEINIPVQEFPEIE